MNLLLPKTDVPLTEPDLLHILTALRERVSVYERLGWAGEKVREKYVELADRIGQHYLDASEWRHKEVSHVGGANQGGNPGGVQ